MSITAISKAKEISVGNIESPIPNLPIPLHDRQICLIVLDGGLDLFLSAWVDGDLTGARRPLVRVAAGAMACGIEPIGNVAIIACAIPGTKILRIPFNMLLVGKIEGIDDPVSLIEGWIFALAGAVAGGEPPGLSPLSIGEGESHTIGEAARVVSSKSRVAWLIHRAGGSSFLGRFPLNGRDGLFPLARQCWTDAAPSTILYAAQTAEVRALDHDSAGVRKFCSLALEILGTRFQEANQVDRERLRTKVETDRFMLARSIQRLVEPVQKIVEVTDSDETCSHPVFLACQMVAARMGFKVRPHPNLLRGIPVKDPVSAIARASNVRVRRVTLKGEWWKSESNGLLCFLEENNVPVAIVNSRRGWEIYNPEQQSYEKLTAATAEKVNPTGYAFYRPFPAVSLTPGQLARFAFSGTSREFALVISAGIATGLLAMLTPYATGIIFDQLIPGAQRQSLWQMCAFLVVATISSSLLGLARAYAVLRLQGKMDSKVQAAVWDRLLSLPVSFFRDYSSGDLAQRSLGISKIREVLTGTTLNAILSGIFSIFSYAMLFYYSWRLALVATALVALACGISVLTGLARLTQQRDMIRLDGKISSSLLQFVTGVSKFRVSATENRAFAAWARQFSVYKTVSANARRLSNRLNVVISVFPLFSIGVFFICFFSFPAFSKDVTTGDLVAFLSAYGQFLSSILHLSTSAVSALSVIPFFERALPILQSVPEVTENKTTPGRLNGAIELNHVVFRYKPDAPPVLRDISLRIAPGEFAAFVGASGSGKSTLFRLLLGFEVAESGAVYFDGQDLAGLDVQSLRSQIGVVLQTSKPVSGSIFDNIVGSAPLTIDDAWAAARAAGLDQDVLRMPMGMHTHISDGGGGISGGQRQRLLIARAIVAKPKILFFDEATSALDNRTQEIVTRSLDGLQATRIVIAHRLSTIINAGRIFVLEKGSIVQTGTYAELVAQDGLFRTLAERQTI